MKLRVYIETTIPSFYCEIRSELPLLAKRQWTREWWDNRSQDYEIFSSEAVLTELENGNYPTKSDCIKFFKDIQLLKTSDDISIIAQTYVDNYLMPKNNIYDAIHLAFASYYHCQILLTWNYSHLANINKIHHIRAINSRMGLNTPEILSPLELLEA